MTRAAEADLTSGHQQSIARARCSPVTQSTQWDSRCRSSSRFFSRAPRRRPRSCSAARTSRSRESRCCLFPCATTCRRRRPSSLTRSVGLPSAFAAQLLGETGPRRSRLRPRSHGRGPPAEPRQARGRVARRLDAGIAQLPQALDDRAGASRVRACAVRRATRVRCVPRARVHPPVISLARR